MSSEVARATAKVDKRKQRGVESRSQILQTAIACIAQVGLGNLTLDRVARDAGVSRGLVVFHFKSKNRLIEKVLQFLDKQYEDGWYVVLNQESESNLAKLLRLIDFDIHYCYQYPTYLATWHAFWGEARGNLLYHNLSLPRDERYASELEQLLKMLTEEGGQDPEELQLIQSGLFSMLMGVWVESHLYPDPENCQVYLDTVRLYLSRCFPNHDFPPQAPPP